MKTKIFGKNMVKKYEVIDNLKEIKDDNGESRVVFTAKPRLKTNTEAASHGILYERDGEPHHNRQDVWTGLSRREFQEVPHINLSEDEEVTIEKEVYRADIDEIHVFTDKVIKESNEGKEDAETRLAELIGDYNEQIIASDEKMTAYCKLHKLDTREADCEEVFNLVYPGKSFAIKNGAIYTNAQTVTLSVADFPSITFGDLNGSHEVTIDLPTANQIIDLGSATSATTSTR